MLISRIFQKFKSKVESYKKLHTCEIIKKKFVLGLTFDNDIGTSRTPTANTVREKRHQSERIANEFHEGSLNLFL